MAAAFRECVVLLLGTTWKAFGMTFLELGMGLGFTKSFIVYIPIIQIVGAGFRLFFALLLCHDACALCCLWNGRDGCLCSFITAF